MAKKQTETQTPQTLPLIGNLRWETIKPFIGRCRESWRKDCQAGRAPKPIKLTPRCTVWRAQDIHKYLADPVGYRAE
jgi:prophage regulatory protein